MDDGAAATLDQALMKHSDELLGVMLTCATGLVTVLGSLVVYSKQLEYLWQPRSLVVALGVATGGMLSFTFLELLPEAQRAFEDVTASFLKPSDADDMTSHAKALVQGYATLLLAGGFAVGVCLIWILDALCLRCAVPTKTQRASRDPTVLIRNEVSGSSQNSFRASPHPPMRQTPRAATQTMMLPAGGSDLSTNELLYKTGKARVVAFAAQNIPEGMVLCLATNQRKTLGVLFACAISMLTMTQGMTLAGLLTQSSGLRWRAVLWCVLAALGLPLGGFLAWALLLLQYNVTTLTLGVFYAVASGLLVSMCLTQILTVCYNHKAAPDSGSSVTVSVLGGVVFIAVLRLLLAFLYV